MSDKTIEVSESLRQLFRNATIVELLKAAAEAAKHNDKLVIKAVDDELRGREKAIR